MGLTTNGKWWKKPIKFHTNQARGEVIELWHFVVQASIGIDMGPKDILDECSRKSRINKQRQEKEVENQAEISLSGLCTKETPCICFPFRALTPTGIRTSEQIKH